MSKDYWAPGFVALGVLALGVLYGYLTGPTKRTTLLVLVTSADCVPCEQMKRDWPDWAPKYRETRDANRYDVIGTPTLIGFDAQGREIIRHQGYNGKEHLEQWLRQLP